MHKLKHIWSHCETCGNSQTYTAYTVHRRLFLCSCGTYIWKKQASSERMISHPDIESIDQLDSYAIAWGA